MDSACFNVYFGMFYKPLTGFFLAFMSGPKIFCRDWFTTFLGHKLPLSNLVPVKK